MNKELREQVYKKYLGRCAYCGNSIAYKEMQVDHILAKANGGEDELKNLNPLCRSCNHYKRAESLEHFRKLLKSIHERLMKIYIFKVAMNYGIIKIIPFDGVFYFEKQKNDLH
jgi:predicted restriction endonuclease